MKVREFIESSAGHIVASFILLLIGAGFYALHIPKHDDIIVFSLGVLARSMETQLRKPNVPIPPAA